MKPNKTRLCYFVGTPYARGKPGNAYEKAKALSNIGVQVTPMYYRIEKFSGGLDEWIFAKIQKTKPNVFLFQKESNLTHNILTRIKTKWPNIRLVQLYQDQRGSIPDVIKERAALLDCLFISNSEQIEMYKKIRIKNVYESHIGVNPKVFKDYIVEPEYDIIFGGSNYGNKFPLSKLRENLINRVDSRFSVIVLGTRWNIENRRPILSHLEYAKMMRKARITIGINAYDVKNYYDARLFQCLSTGRLHLTYYIPNMERDFKRGIELDWFNSIDEAVSKIEYYLRNEQQREETGKNGRNWILDNGTWEIRMRELIEKIQ